MENYKILLAVVIGLMILFEIVEWYSKKQLEIYLKPGTSHLDNKWYTVLLMLTAVIKAILWMLLIYYGFKWFEYYLLHNKHF